MRVCNLLLHGDADTLQLVGVYSTEAHPLGLIYGYADNLDLRQHLRNEPNAGGLKLVRPPLPSVKSSNAFR